MLSFSPYTLLAVCGIISLPLNFAILIAVYERKVASRRKARVRRLINDGDLSARQAIQKVYDLKKIGASKPVFITVPFKGICLLVVGAIIGSIIFSVLDNLIVALMLVYIISLFFVWDASYQKEKFDILNEYADDLFSS